jgi:pantetheine-phosphate adenylyltransferase
MNRIAVFPGTFDPLTKGHEAIVKRSIPLFDKIIVAIGTNSAKNAMFSLEQRMEWIKITFINEPKVEVKTYEGLTVDFCMKENARFILRGLRTPADFEYEKTISQMNLAMQPLVETVFLITDPIYSAISSSIVREIIKHGGEVSSFIPASIHIK